MPIPDNYEPFIALYGNVSIPKAYCVDCDTESFVIRGRLACCDKKIDNYKPTKYRRMSSPEQKRKPPPVYIQEKILTEQEGRCYYCEIPFDTEGIRHGMHIKIKLVWDHEVPFSYSQNNDAENFVASCHVCNALKWATVFQTPDDARVYLALARKEKGYDW